jgi:purine-binding chemotaxis protein CheW
MADQQTATRPPPALTKTSENPAPSVNDLGEPLGAQALSRRAAIYAERVDADGDLNISTYVLFRLGDEHFAVALDDLDEVACIENGIALANVDPVVLGLANLRGELLPLLDTAALLGTRADYLIGGNNRTLIVRDRQGRRSGLPVDRVDAVEALDPGIFQLRCAAAADAPVRRAGIAEHAGTVLSLLDVSGLRRGDMDHF